MDADTPPTDSGKTAPFTSQEARLQVGLFLSIFLICIGYAAYTHHAWEDWYITFRASKNFAAGDGLTFTKGERVYSFTSPLGTTVPALCSLLAGSENDEMALWLYRLFSASLLGLAGVLAFNTLKRLRFAALPIAGLSVSLMFESKIIDHTINGMETGVMLFFLVLTIRAHARESARSWLHLGLAWGGLMWSRPDGCVYGAAIALAFLAFQPTAAMGGNRRLILLNYTRAAGIAALVYLPWFVSTWVYYGSPVPHTIIAKSLEVGPSLGAWGLFIEFFKLPFKAFPHYLTAAEQALVPSYARVFGGWPSGLFVFSRFIVLLSSYCWLLPRVSRVTRTLSLTTLLLTFYLTDVAPYAMPWYLPNLALFVLLAYASVANDLYVARESFAARFRMDVVQFKGLLAVLVAIPCLVLVVTFPFVAHQSRLQQKLVEDGVRTQIGRYLKEQAGSPRDTVMLECLGYIGFFSGLKMYDYPGMGTPEMVAARRRLNSVSGPYRGWGNLSGAQMIALGRELRPDWIVIRPGALRKILQAEPGFLENEYKGVVEVSTREKIAAVPFLPGRAFLLFDATFFIFRRHDALENSSSEQP